MEKITQLTPDQEAKVEVYLKKWTDLGMSTSPIDQVKGRDAVDWLYATILKEEKPEIHYARSPEEAMKLGAKLKHGDGATPEQINQFFNSEKLNYHHGAWWSYWVGFYDFVLNEVFPEEKENFPDFLTYVQHLDNLHMIYPYKGVCLMVDRPEEIHLNKAGQLHNPEGAAIKYRDGFGVYCLNGINVPKYLAETPGMELDVKKVMGETNVDIRREGLRKIPVARILADMNAKELDKWSDPKVGEWCDYALYDTNFGDKQRKILRMRNPSIATEHFERVSDSCNTVLEALAFRDGESTYIQPTVLT